MNILRTLVFYLGFACHTIITGLAFLPVYLGPLHWRRRAHVVWAKGSMILARHVLGITARVEGREHLPAGACVLASKHQSAWETIAFAELFWPVQYVLKKELTYIPIFGWALLATEQIIVDRSAGTKAMRHLIRAGKRAAQDGTRIPIFPEGTRTAIGAQPPLLPGVVALARHLNLPVVPVALNSGKFWPRAIFGKRPGTIIVRILPPLENSLSKDEMLRRLHTQINTAVD
jgi:1-acyl-sn-glycerol-3-phosphate acyltransferase